MKIIINRGVIIIIRKARPLQLCGYLKHGPTNIGGGRHVEGEYGPEGAGACDVIR